MARTRQQGSAAEGRPIHVQPRRSYTRYVIFVPILMALVFATFNALDSIKERFYIFDHKQVHSLAQQAIHNNPNNTRGVIDEIVTSLREIHGPTINTNEEWFFNNAGGAMGAMYIIHASITEYLIIFGTPLGTEGHSGRHWADDYFSILEGEQWAFEAGELGKRVYPKGSVNHMPRGVVRQYKMHEGCWALELAQGWIPQMMPFGLLDGLTSTGDLQTLYDTVRISAREMIANLLRGKF